MTTASPKKFLIVTNPRSGSNLLVDYVNQSRVALCFGEIFKKQFFDTPKTGKHFQLMVGCFTDFQEARDLQLSDPAQFWDIVARNVPGKHRYIGAKLFYSHREKHKLWQDLFQQNPLIIHLWRSNVLHSFLSLERARATDQWALRNGTSGAPRNTTMTFDEQRYIAYRDQNRARFQGIRARRNETESYHEIEYSQVSDPVAIASILNQIFDTTATYKQRLEKQGPSDPLENVENRAVAEKYAEDRLDQ